MNKKNATKIFYTAIFLMPTFVLADVDIKLNCKLLINQSFNSGATERNTRNVVVEVLQIANYLSIITNDNDLGSVGTKKTPTVESIENFSDSNKWDLTTITSREGRITRTSIQIDRNTGLMTYYQDFNKGRIIVNANGNCEKIDTSKKKF